MRIGIDISQLAYENTGVANYLSNLVRAMIERDDKNEYVLFYSSFRRNFNLSTFSIESKPNVSIKKLRFPPTLLDVLWNRLHIFPIERLIGNVDVFITSDWTEPPVKKAKKATIIYDLVVYKTPEETAEKIVTTQKRKLEWVKKESDHVFVISDSTKNDAIELLGLDKDKISVVYPAI